MWDLGDTDDSDGANQTSSEEDPMQQKVRSSDVIHQ